MRTELISCICPTADRPGFLRKSIELFLQQTYPHKELVIIDDGAVPARVPDLPQIRHYRLGGEKRELGPKHQIAFELALGDLVAYWDDDDYFDPRRLELQAQILAREGAAIVGFPRDYVVTVPDCRFWKFKTGLRVDDWVGDFRVHPKAPMNIHDGSALFRRDCLARFRLEELRMPHLELLGEMVAAGEKLVEIPNAGLFVYVRHGGNMWRFKEDVALYQVDRPAWIPCSMMDFWRTEALRG